MTNDSSVLEKAIQLAVQAHADQVDKAGAPYILHPLRLMMKMDTVREKITAVLHDIVEDTDHTIEGLRAEGVPEECLTAIGCLSRNRDESYDEFIDRLKGNALAKRVKSADLEDNMDLKRLEHVRDKDFKRLAKYHRALKILQSQ